MDAALLSLVLPISLFAITMTGTPGPNNMLLTANGANFGIRASLPMILGIRIGMTALKILIALGVGALMQSSPHTFTLLKWLGCGYLAYLAVKIALMPPPGEQEARPVGMWQAAGFQFVNPKSWIALITAFSAFSLPGDLYLESVLLLIVLFNLLGCIMSLCWAGIGSRIALLLATDAAWRRFNRVMALLTLGCIYFILR